MAAKVLIGGVDHTADLDQARPITIELVSNSRGTLRALCLPGYEPARLAPVVAYAQDGTTPLFGGVILQRRLVGVREGSPVACMEIEVAGVEAYLDWCYLTLTYAADTTLATVLAAVVAALPAGYGFTLGGTGYTDVVTAFTWENKRVSDALRELGLACGRVTACTPLKVLSLPVAGTDAAPVTLTDAAPNCLDLVWADPDEVPANTVLLTCGPAGSAVYTQTWTVAGAETTWVADLRAAGAGGYWVVTVAPPTGSAYSGTVGTAPAMFSWDWATQTLTSNIGALAAGTVLTFPYTALYPFTVSATTGATPEIQALATDASITEPARGQVVVNGLRDRITAEGKQVTFTSLEHGWAPGQAVTVDLTARGITGTVLIEQVLIELLTLGFWRYTVSGTAAALTAGTYLDAWRALVGGASAGTGAALALSSGWGGGTAQPPPVHALGGSRVYAVRVPA